MTTIEMSISGGIFVGIIVMSFQTMLAGAKLSSNTVTSDETRSKLEKCEKELNKDLDKATKLVANFAGIGFTHQSNANSVSMLIPKIKDNTFSTTEYEVVTYSLVPEVGKDGPNLLIRTETKVKSGKTDNPKVDKIAKKRKGPNCRIHKSIFSNPLGRKSLPSRFHFHG